MVHCVVIIAAHCGSNLGLLELGVWAIQDEYSTHWETIIFIYYWIAKYICCFINSNQLYVEYICFGWFKYFRVCWTYQLYFVELNIICGVWNELCDCVLRLGVLNIVNGVWETVVVVCLWIWVLL
jgi:hypothetical protein